jgi:hypothetical protein
VTPPTPTSATHHLRLAEDYTRRLWCTDAISELERALADAPELRGDPAVVRAAVPCLRQKTQARTIDFLVQRVGAAARPELALAASSAPGADIRLGAERALGLLGPSSPDSGRAAAKSR